MKIGAISELSTTSIDFNSLSSANNEYLIEISEQNGNIYNSIQYNLAACIKQIGLLILQLLNNIDFLSGRIDKTRGEYLHLSGGTLAGSLNIGSSANPVSNPLNIFASNNTTAIKTNVPAVDFGTVVRVDNNGILNCENDIAGCALTAKWS